MNNTKTAEEILVRIKDEVSKKRYGDLWPFISTGKRYEIWPEVNKICLEEYASPLKKRIEELEAVISSVEEYIRPGMVNGPEIMKLLNPSTNGK